MANEFIARKGLIALENSQITGSLNISENLSLPGFTNVSASLAAAVAGGDNLGNHTALEDLKMGGNAIINVGNVDGVDISTLNSSFNTLKDKTLVSSSAQISSDISGSFTAASASFSTRVTANDAKVSYTDAAVTSVINAAGVISSSAQFGSSDNVTFGTIEATSLNVTNITSSIVTSSILFTEGSNIFGDTTADTHQFTGSLLVTGGLDIDGGNSTVRGSVQIGKLDRPITLTGGNSFLASRPTIEGGGSSHIDFTTGINLTTEKKISFDSDTTNTYIAANNENPEDLEIHADQDVILNPDGQVIANSHISASGAITASAFKGDGSNLTNLPSQTDQNFTNADHSKLDGIEANADVTDTSNVTSAGALMDSELAEIATVKALTAAGISGSFTAASASFSTRVTTNDAKVSYTDAAVTSVINAAGVISSSAQIASDISGSFTAASSSFSTRVTANDAKVSYTDAAVKTKINAEGVISSSAQIADVTLTTAAQTNITSLGTLTTLTVDDITINGSTISDGADLTIDAEGDITLDTNGADVILKDGGTEFGRFKRDSSDFVIKSATNNKDIVFRGVDDSTTITALTLDMSDAGKAIFTSDVSSSGDIIGNDITSSNNILIKGGGLSIKNKGAQSYARFYCESNNAHYTEIKAQEHANFSGNVTLLLPAYDFDFASPDFGSADLAANNLSGTNTGDQDLSGLALKTSISGAFAADSASFSTRVTANDAKVSYTDAAVTSVINAANILSSSAQISSDISGSFTAASASFSTRVTANDAKLTANTSNVTTAGALMDSELADLAAVKAINQGLTTTSNVTFNDVDVDGTLTIPGFANVSASLAAAVAGGDNLGNHTALEDLKMGGNAIKNALHITASGNISASGNVDASSGRFSQLFIDGESALNTADSATTGQVFNDSQITKIKIGKTGAVTSTVIEGNITASSNISASGAISASAFVGDGSGLTGLSSAAVSTYTNAGDNRIITSVNSTTINSEANLTFDGNSLNVTGHITASGDISASGDVFGLTLHSGDDIHIRDTQFVDLHSSGFRIGVSSTALTIFGDTITLGGTSATAHVTASGNISASGTGSFTHLNLPGFDFDSEASDTELIVGGNISSSGDITANTLNVDNLFESSATGSILSKVHQNIYDTGSLALNTDSAFGDIVKFGGTSTTAGKVYFLKGDGTWGEAQADAAATATGSLAVAVGGNSTTDGMCLRGFVHPETDPGAGIGSPVFLSDVASGKLLATAPSSNNDVVRILGHQYGTDLIYFNPSNDFIVITA